MLRMLLPSASALIAVICFSLAGSVLIWLKLGHYQLAKAFGANRIRQVAGGIDIRYREMSLWLRIWNPSPIKTEEAHSVSSTCNASAASPCGRVSSG